MRLSFHRKNRRQAHARIGVHAELSGWFLWEVLNPDGTVAAQGSQSNLILDRGMNTFGTVTTHDDTNNSPRFSLWRSYLCVGTGSTAPAVTQTTLVSEVMRGNSNGGFTSELTTTFATAGGKVTGTFQMVRVLDFTASYNLTEFGLSDLSTAGGQICIRELIRDGGGNPITLSVQSGQQLKVTHLLTISLDYANTVSASFTITGLGLMTGKATVFTANTFDVVFTAIFNPGGGAISLRPMTGANTGDPAALGGTAGTASSDYVFVGSSAIQPYVSGSFARTKQFILTTSQANYAHYGWIISDVTGALPNRGWKFTLTNPVSVTKDATKKLTLDFEVSWARAS